MELDLDAGYHMAITSKLTGFLILVLVAALGTAFHFRGEQLMSAVTGQPAPSAEVESVVGSLAVTHGEREKAVRLLVERGLNVAEMTIMASGKEGILIAYKQPSPLFVVLSSGLILTQKPVLSDPAEAAEFDRALKIAAIEWEAQHPDLARIAEDAGSEESKELERLRAETAQLEAALGPALTATAPDTDPVALGLMSEDEMTDLLLEQLAVQEEQAARDRSSQPPESAFIDYGGTPIRKIGFGEDGKRLPAAEARAQAAGLFAKLRPSFGDWTITYPASGEEKHEVLVFTDWTCPYCRRMHSRIDQLNARGITVHYMLFPRKLLSGREAAGPTLEGFRRAWCSADRAMAFDDLLAGIDLDDPGQECTFDDRSDFPAEEHFVMGLIYGIRGTPLTVASDGSQSTGFSSVDKLLADLSIDPIPN